MWYSGVTVGGHGRLCCRVSLVLPDLLQDFFQLRLAEPNASTSRTAFKCSRPYRLRFQGNVARVAGPTDIKATLRFPFEQFFKEFYRTVFRHEMRLLLFDSASKNLDHFFETKGHPAVESETATMASYPFKPTEKWDVHTHTTLSPHTFEKLEKFASTYADFVRVRAHKAKPCCAEMINGNGEVVRVIEDDAYSGEARLKACDRDGVTVQVLSPTPMMIPDYVDNPQDAATICQILNDDNQRLVEAFPDRFVAIGALPMLHPKEAIKELERLQAIGMEGVEINSNVNGHDLDDPRFFPIFEACAEMNFGVFIHPWGGFMKPKEDHLKERMHASRNWRPWLTAMPLETALAFDSLVRGMVHERLPHLRVLYAHGGGTFPALLGRLEHGAYCRPDIFMEQSDRDVWSIINECGVYTDTLTHNPWALNMLVELLGSSRLALGSDYPYPLGEIDPFDEETLEDPKQNKCPYCHTKNIYPGHMVEHLPNGPEQSDLAWDYFNWIPRSNPTENRTLPRLTVEEKENILHRTAKVWLGISKESHGS